MCCCSEICALVVVTVTEWKNGGTLRQMLDTQPQPSGAQLLKMGTEVDTCIPIPSRTQRVMTSSVFILLFTLALGTKSDDSHAHHLCSSSFSPSHSVPNLTTPTRTHHTSFAPTTPSSQICSALAYLHSLHVVHRDLKPENILMDENQTIFLCDFGLSKVFRHGRDVGISMDLGTAAYMAPELNSPTRLTSLENEETEQLHKDRLDSFSLTNLTSESSVASMLALQSGGKWALSDDGKHAVTDGSTAAKTDCFSLGIVLWAMFRCVAWVQTWSGLNLRMCAGHIFVHIVVILRTQRTTLNFDFP